MKYDIDPYEVLGIPPEATLEVVKRAYRQLAQRLHPDKNPNNAAAVKLFQDVSAAYEIVTDYDKRKDYDKFRQKHTQKKHFKLYVTPSKRIIFPLGEEQVIYMLAQIIPSQAATEEFLKHKTRLNLTLVLDQSNSMNKKNRLNRVKAAAQTIIQGLSEDDIISVVTFNDRATVVIPATPIDDKNRLAARIGMINARGGTEILQGLQSGVNENRKYAGPLMVNHIILLTDGKTYGDEAQCLQLVYQVRDEGIGVSAMGLGQEWNDQFLDELAAITGGTSSYISSIDKVVQFMDEHVKSLSKALVERIQLTIVPDPDIEIEMAFKLAPQAQPLPAEDGIIPLSNLQANRPIIALIQLLLPGQLDLGRRTIGRFVAAGDVLQDQGQRYQSIQDITLNISDQPIREKPPTAILDALSKLTLYRLQEKAQQALDEGDVIEATRRLNNLATRLFELGQEELALQAQAEASHVANTHALSAKGSKTIKYQTRALLQPGDFKDALSTYATMRFDDQSQSTIFFEDQQDTS